MTYSGEKPRLLTEVVEYHKQDINKQKEVAEEKEKQVPEVKVEVIRSRRP